MSLLVQPRNPSHCSRPSEFRSPLPSQLTEERLKELIQIFGGTIERGTTLLEQCFERVLKGCEAREWKKLESNKADIGLLKDRWGGRTILQIFIEVADVQTAKGLIERKIALTSGDQWGKSAMSYAISGRELANSKGNSELANRLNQIIDAFPRH